MRNHSFFICNKGNRDEVIFYKFITFSAIIFYMNIKTFFKSNWHHFAIVAIMFVITAIYFSPQFAGYGLKQHDVEQYVGSAKEIADFRKETGKEPLWTNSMFGGMPATQISVVYEGNYFQSAVNTYLKVLPPPAGQTLLYMLGFYVLMLCLRVNPWLGLFGSLAFAFSSYDIIILQAGHNTKALAVAFMAPVLGGFYLAYKRKLYLGILLSAIFMSFEIGMNHLQVTYYLAMLLILVGVVFLVQAILSKQIKEFTLATLGLFAAYALAVAVNYGNISMTNEYAKHTIRGGNDVTLHADGTSNNAISTPGLDKDYITNWSYGIGESFTLLSPYVKGYGSVAIGSTPYAENLLDHDLNNDQLNAVSNSVAYWGDQPMTSGPVYVGVIVCFLAFLGMFFLKTPLKWGLFAMTLLSLVLSWGKNYMGFTDFFLDHIPGYNKFRAVTIILVIAELTIPILGILFLDLLFKEKEQFQAQKKKLLVLVGVFFVFLIGMKLVGLNDGYITVAEKQQLANVEAGVMNQLRSMQPEVLQSQYGIDITNQQQVQQVIDQQKQGIEANFTNLKEVRKGIFDSSMNRSILFVLFSAALILAYVYTEMKGILLVLGTGVLFMLDMIPVAYNYLGKQEEGISLKYWDLKANTLYPMTSSEADEQILVQELQQAPSLQKYLDQAHSDAQVEVDKYEFTGAEKRRVEDAYKYAALKRHTNFRVFDLQGGFQSSKASYFHKSLGGYHGAKLRNIQNVFEYHIAYSNQAVFDMLNVKYFISADEQGRAIAQKNSGALGPVWFVQKVRFVSNPNEEIRALGSAFSLVNKGPGTLVINGESKNSSVVYGAENIQYVLKNDSINVRIPNGINKGLKAHFVSDLNAKTNWVPDQTLEADPANSFLKLIALEVTEEFNPKEEAIVLDQYKDKLSGNRYSGAGTIKMIDCNSNKIVYQSNSSDKQFAVFSEIFYADGWKAFVDGKETEIVKTDYLLRGLELSAGNHKIEFVFDLKSYHTAKILGLVGSIVILLASILYIYRKRKQ